MKVDVYQKVTDEVIAALESGDLPPWRKPWMGGDAPTNLVSRRPYRGVNVFLLAIAPYASPYWVSYKQARSLGGSVKKGEKSRFVVYFNVIEKEDKKTGEKKNIPFIRYSNVFNVEQCEGLDKHIPQNDDKLDFQPIERCEQIVNGFDDIPNLIEGNGRAFYRPLTDEIGMPKKEDFKGVEEYYSTLFHEMTHSTGHKSRLARDGIMDVGVFGGEAYSREELIAEMGAAMLCGEAEISPTVIENSAAYLKGWLSKLRDDKKLIVQAASQAQKAADYIRGRQATSEDKGEDHDSPISAAELAEH